MSVYKKPELLAPAGTLDAIKAVLEAGADAVYVSGKTLSMRQHRGSYNFTADELAEAVAWVHDQGKKLYYTAQFHWVRKQYEPAPGLEAPDAFVTSDGDVAPTEMPDCNGVWATTRFADPGDLRHDMHVNIVTFQPGGCIPFAETHVMEHGLYVLQGTAEYLLNKDWVSVGPGDFMWLRAFCPQACIATGTEPFRYLLYKDVNRHPAL